MNVGRVVPLKECPGASQTRERSSRQAAVALNEERRPRLWPRIPLRAARSCTPMRSLGFSNAHLHVHANTIKG